MFKVTKKNMLHPEG